MKSSLIALTLIIGSIVGSNAHADRIIQLGNDTIVETATDYQFKIHTSVVRIWPSIPYMVLYYTFSIPKTSCQGFLNCVSTPTEFLEFHATHEYYRHGFSAIQLVQNESGTHLSFTFANEDKSQQETRVKDYLPQDVSISNTQP